ncbi:MAG: L-alanine-DL-glutamate epimerase, partial [Clostridiales bacterium]|nr:L-alanine-DL-glutamate epimerase [Clostridiales bacterium]
MITIKKAVADFIREPLLSPFGFKGGHVSEIWQSVVRLESNSYKSLGLGIQSVLWSDAGVFAGNCPAGGNAIMFAMTCHAAKLLKGMTFENPGELLDRLLPPVLEYGKLISGFPSMRMTFALNALVPIDLAAWVLYARENKLDNFDDIIPDYASSAMTHRHSALSKIPLITYGLGREDIEKILSEGSFVLKIKIGSDPDGDGDVKKMLSWDKSRLSLIHELADKYSTEHTDSGKIAYYLDANGRYPDKNTLLRLLDHADKIGALDRIVLLEEPFDELNEVPVHDVPLRLASDESAHCADDAVRRIELGYSAIALKPIAKTLSMSFRILREAYERNVPCFCADLTVTPIMLEWNKSFASRLSPLPGLRTGVVESNGDQNYVRWEELCSYHPLKGASYITPVGGAFRLGDEFYRDSGGIFLDSEYY